MNKSGGALGVQKAELSGEAGSETTKDAPLKDSMYYIGLDIHKKTISYCVKDQSGQICVAGIIPATRGDLDRWMNTLPQPWTAAMEATMFTGWIYDHLVPHAPVKVTHPLMFTSHRRSQEEK